MKRRTALWVAVLLAIAPVVVGAQDLSCGRGSDVEVRKLSFAGNRSFSDAVLADGLVTTASSWTRRWLRFMGTRRCLDRAEFVNDVVRLQIFYRNHGYSSVAVDTAVTPIGPTAVAIEFVIREGIPTLVDTLRVNGLDAIPDADRLTAQLPLRQGSAFNKYALQRSIDTLTRRLRDTGYPSAEVFYFFATDTAAHSAVVEIDVEPGTRAVIGEIALDITPVRAGARAVSDETVRQLLGVKSGDVYRESSLERAKRTLYQTDIYRVVAVDVDSADVVPPGDSLVDVRISLIEGLTTSARVSGGYGTLDCIRTEGEYRDANVFNSARRLEARARVSKIGIGRPLGGAAGLCPMLRDDPYSEQLNYYTGLSLIESTDRLLSWRPAVTVYSEQRSEFRAYFRATPVGTVLSATRQAGRRLNLTATYQIEFGRTEAQPALFCALQSVCTAEDRDPLLRFRRLAVAGWAMSQDWSNDAQNPTRGGVARFEVRHAASGIGSDRGIQFNKLTGDLTMYLALRPSVVLAMRGRAGVVTGPSFTGRSSFIPPQERLFAGGPTSVRGFQQSDLGPKVYITRGFDTVRVAGATGPIGADETVYFRARNEGAIERPVPTGGSALVVGNVELRMPFFILEDRLQWTVFADAGELWTSGATQSQDRFQSLKVTPGVGIRVATPFGLFRMDVAYNRYDARRGAAFYDQPVLSGGQLFCVSPGNTLAVTGVGVPGTIPIQASGSCATDFDPGRVRQRLRFAVAIGQAF